jgi:hypothetical protein
MFTRVLNKRNICEYLRSMVCTVFVPIKATGESPCGNDHRLAGAEAICVRQNGEAHR